MSTPSAQPSASGPSTSHRNSGTPSSRSMLITFGTVHTRASRVASSTTFACTFPESGIVRSDGDTLTVRATRPPAVRRCRRLQMRAVADLPDQLLDHVLQRGRAEGGPGPVDDPCHVCASSLQLLQGVVQQVVLADQREGPDPLVLD